MQQDPEIACAYSELRKAKDCLEELRSEKKVSRENFEKKMNPIIENKKRSNQAYQEKIIRNSGSISLGCTRELLYQKSSY